MLIFDFLRLQIFLRLGNTQGVKFLSDLSGYAGISCQHVCAVTYWCANADGFNGSMYLLNIEANRTEIDGML